MSSPDDVAACEAILRRGSKSFAAAALLLPRRVRTPASVVYAFCRVADDAVDGAADPADGLERMRERLARVYAGSPVEDPVDRALAAVVRAHRLPRAVFDALLEGFAWDVEGRRYETLADLRAYCARVAATVGVAMTLLMGERRERVLRRACDLGVAIRTEARVSPRRAFSRRRVPEGSPGGRDRVPPGSRAVVVGGGIAGIAAATVLAERGVGVTLVEREPFLGGRAGAWTDRLADGTPFEMERGFHGFFRQYYNLRELLRRVDPALSFLLPLEDYPLLGPDGMRESFSSLARLPGLNVADLVRRTDSLRVRDLPRVGVRPALAMLAFDPERTYARWDDTSARAYLDSLRFPPRARQMLFDVFSHSFFNPEDGLSAGELLMNFHFYFVGNPEGLVFDVTNEPFSTALWTPMRRYLESHGVELRLSTAAERVERREDRHAVVLEGGERIETDGVVLAVTVPALQRIVEASPALGDDGFRRRVASLELTHPFAVWRLWLDRPCAPERAPFAGTAGLGPIDNISVYDRFEGESRRWAERTGGSVVELHAYAVPPDAGPEALKRDLLGALHALYPETRAARVLEERWLLRQDCPAFAPGSRRDRPRVETPTDGVVLAGDFVRTDVPCALMERATVTGFEAANRLLARWRARPEPLWSVPPRGLLGALPL